MIEHSERIRTLPGASKQGRSGVTAHYPTRPPDEVILFLVIAAETSCGLRWRLGPLRLEQLEFLVNLPEHDPHVVPPQQVEPRLKQVKGRTD